MKGGEVEVGLHRHDPEHVCSKEDAPSTKPIVDSRGLILS